MKKCILLFLLFPVLSLAKNSVVITPSLPAKSCTLSNPSSFLNRVGSMHVEESSTKLVIEFTTLYYKECVNMKPIQIPISEYFIFAYWTEALKWPWTSSPFETESYELSNDSKELYVKLVYDKLEGFKKRDQRKITFQFIPASNPRNYPTFTWHLQLTKVDDENTNLSFFGNSN